MGKGKKHRIKPDNLISHKRKNGDQWNHQKSKHGKPFAHRGKNPFHKGLPYNSEPTESKREIVKNEVLEYLQKAKSNKPWKEEKKSETIIESTDGNPFRSKDQPDGPVRWEKFKDDTSKTKKNISYQDLTADEKNHFRRVITSCTLTQYRTLPTLNEAVYMIKNKMAAKKCKE